MPRTSRSERESKKRRSAVISVLILVVLALIGWLAPEFAEQLLGEALVQTGLVQEVDEVDASLKVHFIDVGQGDSILIQTPAQNILLDAGNPEDADTVTDYLRQQGVKRLDLVIASHMHADHIGGLGKVLERIPADVALFPPMPDRLIPTTASFERLLDQVEEQQMQEIEVHPGSDTLDLGGGVVLEVLGPLLNDPEDLNDTSVVCRLTFGTTAFMLTGDAETASEAEILKRYDKSALSADVLKLGHHGSRTSSSEAWLDTVRPRYAIGMCGKDNSYGHPHDEIVKRLADREIPLYRTDESGTIVIGSDGTNLQIQSNS